MRFGTIVNSTPVETSLDALIWSLLKHFPHLIDDTNYSCNVSEYIDEQLTLSLDVPVSIADVSKRVDEIRGYRRQLTKLRQMPQVAQRSEEWYEMRRGRLTASAIDQALDVAKHGKSKAELVFSKSFPEYDKPFNSMGSPPLRHGIILEEMSARCYSQRLGNIRIHEFGMIPHPSMSCFGASPDGINELGIMVEIKTPYRRKVDGTILQGYMWQMQGQMSTCDLPECDFVDACIKFDYRSTDGYLHDIDANATVDHGVIVEYMVDGVNTFDYSPEYMTSEEAVRWGMETRVMRQTDKPLLPWKLHKIMITRVRFDSAMWNDLAPKIESFWEEVLTMRATGCNKPYEKEKTKNINKSTKSKNNTVQFVDSSSDED
jgi:putative phage-type endonuclease